MCGLQQPSTKDLNRKLYAFKAQFQNRTKTLSHTYYIVEYAYTLLPSLLQ